MAKQEHEEEKKAGEVHDQILVNVSNLTDLVPEDTSVEVAPTGGNENLYSDEDSKQLLNDVKVNNRLVV